MYWRLQNTGMYRIIFVGGKQEGDVDARIIEILGELKSDQIKEIALRQLQALTILA